MSEGIRANPFTSFVIGINYMPRESACEMWEDWSESSIERDFKQMKELGLNTVRTFIFWNDFQPQPDSISLPAIEKFDKMLQIAQKYGLKLMPTFFTGHMSGEHYDVPWHCDRDIWEDPFMLKAQATLVRYFADRYADCDAVLCWDLANEHDTFAQPRSAYSGWLWTHLLYREMKSFDPTHPITVGTHITSLLKDKLRFDMIAADFLCTHPYPIYTPFIIDPLDTIRSTLFPAFSSKLAQCLGKRRVMLQEFGTSTEMTSEDMSARFYQSVLYSSLINESIGALAWCWADYTVPPGRKPYTTTPHEFEFGITDYEGRPKKHAFVLKKFAEVVDLIEYVALTPEKPKAAIVVPHFYYEERDVFLPAYSAEAQVRSLFSAFILAKQANFDVDFIKPDDPFIYDLLIFPSVPIKGYLTALQWKKVEQYVADGGNIYCSYNGVAFPGLNELFGIEAITQLSPPEMLTLHLDQTNVTLSYSTVSSKVMLAAEYGGESLARDQDNNPAIIRNKYGEGTTLFVAYPIEYYLSFMLNAAQTNDSYQLYKIAGQNIQSSIEYGNPFVESKLFYGKQEKYVVLVNHSNTPTTCSFKINVPHSPPQRISPRSNATGPEKPYVVTLEPNGCVILRVG
jgi:beta-galactosidase